MLARQSELRTRVVNLMRVLSEIVILCRIAIIVANLQSSSPLNAGVGHLQRFLVATIYYNISVVQTGNLMQSHNNQNLGHES